MRIVLFLLICSLLSCTPKPGTEKTAESEVQATSPTSAGVYELRTYYAATGKLDNLLTRFRDHTAGLFEKQGMVNVGYWIPTDNQDNQLIYLMGYESREVREEAWKAFRSDPDWIKAKADSEVEGKLVDSIKTVFLIPTSYSPELKITDLGPRVFEMRTYYTNEGKLDDLHARFENHTMAIFENNNMSNVVYFNLDTDQDGADNTLLYFISHSDEGTAGTNWQKFIDDPQWQAAYKASIESGNLVSRLTSVFLEPVDFSPIK